MSWLLALPPSPNGPDPVAIRGQLDRILASEVFVQSERSAGFLRYIVERALQGDSNSLKEYAIGLEVFGRPETFDPRLDAIVRVEAGRLRTRLAEYYRGSGAGDSVEIGLPKGSYAPAFAQRQGPSEATRRRPGFYSKRIAWLAAACAVAAVLAAIAVHFWPRTQTPVAVLSRLTADPGITITPAFSADGRFIAYASDRGTGNLDIWTQQTRGGSPLRITKDPSHDYEPSFSPDGSRIVFRSDRNEGGLYVISSLGGEEKLLAPGGRSPRYSPDGRWIAYYSGNGLLNSKVWVIPAEGGQPRQISPTGFQVAAFPVWSPDSRRILFAGSGQFRKGLWNFADWWTAPLTGGEPAPTGALEEFKGFHFWPHPQFGTINPAAWANGYIYFPAMVKDTTNIWRIPISNWSLRAAGPPERLTLGSTEDGFPAVFTSRGHVQVAFVEASQKLKLWTFLLDERGKALATTVRQVTHDPANDYQPMLARDGNHAVWIDTRAGYAGNIRMIDFASGAERAITDSSGDKSTAVLDREGSRVAYGLQEGEPYTLYAQSIEGGFLDKLCSNCGSLYDWSPRANEVLIGREGYLDIFDLKSHSMARILDDVRCQFGGFRYSPDGAWLAFMSRCGGKPEVRIARLSGLTLTLPSDWVTIAAGSADHPNWGKRGDILYYRTFVREPVIVGQRIDPETKRPTGEPFQVYPPASEQRDLAGPRRTLMQFSAGGDRVVFTLDERSSNIWIADLGSR